ncbi:MAG TPA: GNAT family N-acetyltransferase, partial [Hyphomicrobiaceae bacterium]
DPDRRRAEFSVLVRSDVKAQGLGWALVTEIIAYARREGVKMLFGEVLRDNTQMLQMCRELGFSIEPDPDDSGIVTVTIDLDGAPASRGAAT